jgi:hypothetical protein
MEELESELESPTGVTTAQAPPLILDGVLISKSCGILLETRDAKGLKSVLLLKYVTKCLVGLTVMHTTGCRGFGARLLHVTGFLPLTIPSHL